MTKQETEQRCSNKKCNKVFTAYTIGTNNAKKCNPCYTKQRDIDRNRKIKKKKIALDFRNDPANEGFRLCEKCYKIKVSYDKTSPNMFNKKEKVIKCKKCAAGISKTDNKRKNKNTLKKKTFKDDPANKGLQICYDKSCHNTFPEEIRADNSYAFHTKCPQHRNAQRNVESNRSWRDRGAEHRAYERRPEVIAMRALYRTLHWDKVATYWKNSRTRRKNKYGIDEYRRINAQQAARWRRNNPKKAYKLQEKIKVNPLSKLNSLKYQAMKKNNEWVLDDEYALAIIDSICFYCDNYVEGCCNGIDRVNNMEPYTTNNSVSCCKHCNYMKSDCDIIFWFDKIEDILTFQRIITDGISYPYTYVDTQPKNVNYKKYKKSAEKRKKEFTLTKFEFSEIISGDCYLCGRENTETHQNGIDRVDNKIGYTELNCKPCCSICNYFKRDMNEQEFLNHIEEIYCRKTYILNKLFVLETSNTPYYSMSTSDKVDFLNATEQPSNTSQQKKIQPTKLKRKHKQHKTKEEIHERSVNKKRLSHKRSMMVADNKHAHRLDILQVSQKRTLKEIKNKSHSKDTIAHLKEQYLRHEEEMNELMISIDSNEELSEIFEDKKKLKRLKENKNKNIMKTYKHKKHLRQNKDIIKTYKNEKQPAYVDANNRFLQQLRSSIIDVCWLCVNVTNLENKCDIYDLIIDISMTNAKTINIISDLQSSDATKIYSKHIDLTHFTKIDEYNTLIKKFKKEL